jgi:hypothetical protein
MSNVRLSIYNLLALLNGRIYIGANDRYCKEEANFEDKAQISRGWVNFFSDFRLFEFSSPGC